MRYNQKRLTKEYGFFDKLETPQEQCIACMLTDEEFDLLFTNVADGWDENYYCMMEQLVCENRGYVK
jgi:hypothetical protein